MNYTNYNKTTQYEDFIIYTKYELFKKSENYKLLRKKFKNIAM